MKAIVFDKVGPPLSVLEVRDVPTPRPGDRDVLIEMTAASINPGDFMFIQSIYPEPKKPRFPAQIPGTGGGAGRVVAAGKSTSIAVGTPVAFSWYAAWAEYAVVPEAWLFRLPEGYDLETAAQLGNIITAWDMIETTKVAPGQWLAITGAHSAVATMMLQLARERDVRVLAIVRRTQPDLDLRAWGATEVLATESISGDLEARVAEITSGNGLGGVVDCVGGPLFASLVRSLGLGGRAVLYGAFSPETFALHAIDMLVKASRIETYVYRYFFDPPSAADASFLGEILRVSGAPQFRTRIAARHPLDDFRNAIGETLERPERGKHLFRMKTGV